MLVTHCLIEGLTVDGQDLVGLLQLSIAVGDTYGKQKKVFATPSIYLRKHFSLKIYSVIEVQNQPEEKLTVEICLPSETLYKVFLVMVMYLEKACRALHTK